MKRYIITIALMITTYWCPYSVSANEPGTSIYQARCAVCHTGAGKDTGPTLDSIQAMSSAEIRFTLLEGKMKGHASSLSDSQLESLLRFLVGDRPDSATVSRSSTACSNNPISFDATMTSWGFNAQNTRHQTHTLISADNVHRLELAWSFGLPETSTARSQPIITDNTVFVATTSGHVYALDRASGCERWHYRSENPLRTSLTLGTVNSSAALFIGDQRRGVLAIDARRGRLLWRSQVGLFDASMLTGATVQHDNRLFVPISAFGVALAQNPDYECCKSHGGVRALDADTGNILWTAHMTPNAEKTYENSAGTQMWGPSGAPVWTTPAVDPKRRRIYIGTGENTSTPATELSDAIVAIDMDTGQIVWSYQGTSGDAFNMACGWRRGPSCPKENGPDFDFGASPAIATLSNGRDVIVAGQKSGDVHCLDADTGTLIWRTKVGQGSALGGIHWGIAVSKDRVVVPVADPGSARDNYQPTPGVYVLDLDTGKVIWSHKAERGCTPKNGEQQRARRRSGSNRWPACPRRFAFSAAASSTPDLAFASALNGHTMAFDLSDGTVLWEYDTVQQFDTVNGVEAHGGAIDSAGAQVVDDMLFVQSGYGMFGQMPGNVLLAYRLQNSELNSKD